MIKYSIIIPIVKADDKLEYCLDCLFKSIGDRDDVEVIVVDNRPGEGNRDKLKRWQGVIVLEEEYKKGSYAARNTGIRLSRGEYILFCDSDCFVDRHWFHFLIKAVDNVPIACGRYIIYKPRKWFDFFQAKIVRRWYSISNTFKGSSAILRKDILEDSGCFDESFLYSGDVDFGLMLQEKGYGIFIENRALIFHAPRASLPEIRRQYFNYGYGNACVVSKRKSRSPVFMRRWYLKFLSAIFHCFSYLYWVIFDNRLGRRKLWHFFLMQIDFFYFIGFLKGLFRNVA